MSLQVLPNKFVIKIMNKQRCILTQCHLYHLDGVIPEEYLHLECTSLQIITHNEGQTDLISLTYSLKFSPGITNLLTNIESFT